MRKFAKSIVFLTLGLLVGLLILGNSASRDESFLTQICPPRRRVLDLLQSVVVGVHGRSSVAAGRGYHDHYELLPEGPHYFGHRDHETGGKVCVCLLNCLLNLTVPLTFQGLRKLVGAVGALSVEHRRPDSRRLFLLMFQQFGIIMTKISVCTHLVNVVFF